LNGEHSNAPAPLATETKLTPTERVALTVALSQVREGRELTNGVATMCVLALGRVTGTYDYTKEAP
jgi:hypothetical protein